MKDKEEEISNEKNFMRQIIDITYAVRDLATQEAEASNLPGRTDGPADAYRHMLLAAELTRRYGETCAGMLPDGHERTGDHGSQTQPAETMDRHNNEMGIVISKRLRESVGDMGRCCTRSPGKDRSKKERT